MANGQFGFTADIPAAISAGLQLGRQQNLIPLQNEQAALGLRQQRQQLSGEALQQKSTQQQIDIRSDEQKNRSLVDSALRVSTLPDNQIVGFLQKQIADVEAKGGSASETKRALDLALTGDFETVRSGAQNLIDIGVRQGIIKPEGGSITAAQREFADLTEGLTAEQKDKAKLIELGLSPRAVGSAIQTISSEGIADQIGDAEATIKERAKFGELTGSSRAKRIDSGFDRIGKISTNINNLDRAIEAVEAGAGTGAIERRFPSIKAAAVELDQIQGELALDVIGSVTFGALSEGELNLAKQIALPTGLQGPALIQHLQDRKAAQEKLRSYFKEQVDFLDQGGTVAGFLREKERQAAASAPDQAAGAGGVQVGEFTVRVK